MWSVPKRIAFRFGFIAGALWIFPFPLGAIPWTDSLAELANKPSEWLTLWFAESILGLEPSTQPTGSGDTVFQWSWTLLVLILAAIGAAVWSALDRKRLGYPRLASASLVVLRYVLAFNMLGYGFAKIYAGGQFIPPTLHQLDTRVGDMSPMGLLWRFMGYSRPYTVFAGLAEAIGGVLLMWRRTATAGALLIMAVMANVFLLNMSYDVPVKLFSAELLIIAGVIAMPQLRRILGAVLGYATPAVPDRVRMSAARERVRLALKCLMILSAVVSVYRQREFTYQAPEHDELYGAWSVEPLPTDSVTDKTRWRRVMFGGTSMRIRPDVGDSWSAAIEVKAAEHVVVVKKDKQEQQWHYTLSENRLVIDGTWDDKPFHRTLVRDPEAPLMTRPFHWVQEQPYNR